MLSVRRVALPFLVSSLTPLAEAVTLELSLQPASGQTLWVETSVQLPAAQLSAVHAPPESFAAASLGAGAPAGVSSVLESLVDSSGVGLPTKRALMEASPGAGPAQLAIAKSTISVLEALPPHVSDQDKPEALRRAHDQEVALAIDSSTEDRLERGMLVALGWHESRFAMDVCRGDTHGDEGRAYGCWQSWSRERGGGMAEQAQRALDALRKGGNFCAARGHDRLFGSFSLYATGKTCSWPGASRRVRMARSVAARL